MYSQISLKTFMGQKVHHGGTVIDALFQPLIDGFSQGCVVLGPRLQENWKYYVQKLNLWHISFKHKAKKNKKSDWEYIYNGELEEKNDIFFRP